MGEWMELLQRETSIDVRWEKKCLFQEKVWVAGCVNADLFPILVPVARGATSLAPVIQHVAVVGTLVHIKYLISCPAELDNLPFTAPYHQRPLHGIHDPGGRKSVFQQLGHGLTILADVEKELLVSLAQVVKPRFIVVAVRKAMFGASAPDRRPAPRTPCTSEAGLFPW